MNLKIRITLIILVLVTVSCTKKHTEINLSPDDFHTSVDKVTEVIVHDIFSPPVASRIYNYANIASYEVIAQNDTTYKSLAHQLKGYTAFTKPEDIEDLNYKAASIIAYLDVAKELLFSKDMITTYQDSLYASWSDINEKSFQNSKEFGLAVASHVKKWMATDNYNETRSMPKYTVDADEPSRWQPTPPDYMDGIEPHWSKIRTLVIDSAAQFKPLLPPKFSLDKKSTFYKELMEVYEVGNKIKKIGDDSEEIAIARFWDCNPYVSTHKGHLMFATKKITPGAHWIGICKIASKKTKADFNKTIYAYTKTSIAIADAFISCWDEKYRSNLIRPETLINQYLDEDWMPILQTPPFPEYTSGHSVVSGAAAITLTDIFGDNFTFDDDTELPYGLPIRSFTSFNQAAEEAAISRLYGGIHYRAAIDEGLKQGKNVGNYIVTNLKMIAK